jgi:very-short-patch-repair endonuclease
MARLEAKENLRKEIPPQMSAKDFQQFVKTGKFEPDQRNIAFAKKELEKLRQERRKQRFIESCKDAGLDVVPEYKFHETRKWRIDFYFESGQKKVALEIEGGVWSGGRHTRGSGFQKDMEKYNEMTKHGILLLRFQPKDLDSPEDIISTIKNALDA